MENLKELQEKILATVNDIHTNGVVGKEEKVYNIINGIEVKRNETIDTVEVSIISDGKHPNDFIHQIALEFNCAGFFHEDAKDVIVDCGMFSMKKSAISKIVDSVYKQYMNKFAVHEKILYLKLHDTLQNFEFEIYVIPANGWKTDKCK